MTNTPTTDPDFPFLLLSIDGITLAKFASLSLAQAAARRDGYFIVDTRPIPNDASIISFVSAETGTFAVGYRVQGDEWNVMKDGTVVVMSCDAIVAEADGGGVTVLDPRAAS